jgi:peptidoglycan/LPS O-acetylase OafA/YrhL
MKRRIERIYPTFIVVFLTYVVLSFVFPSENNIPPSLREGFIYLAQNFFLLPGLFPIPPLNTVTWSLSYEMLYYLVIPLVVSIFTLRQQSTRVRILFFMVMTVLLVSYHLFFYGHERLIMFIAGILLSEVIEHHLLKLGRFTNVTCRVSVFTHSYYQPNQCCPKSCDAFYHYVCFLLCLFYTTCSVAETTFQLDTATVARQYELLLLSNSRPHS